MNTQEVRGDLEMIYMKLDKLLQKMQNVIDSEGINPKSSLNVDQVEYLQLLVHVSNMYNISSASLDYI